MNDIPGSYNYPLRATSALLLALCGLMFYSLQPSLVSALVELKGFSLQQVANIASSQAAGQLAAILILSGLMPKLPVRPLTIVFVGLVVATELLSCIIDSAPGFLALRFINGLFSGGMLAMGTAIIAGMRNSERLYVAMMALQATVAGAVLFLMPHVLPLTGLSGVFLFIAVLAIGGGLLVQHLPERTGATDATQPTDDRARVFSPQAVSVLLVFLIQLVAMGMVWTFTTRIALQSGLSDTDIGTVFGTMPLFTLAAAFATMALGNRLGHLIPVLVGLVFVTACCLIHMVAMSFTLYLTAVLCMTVGTLLVGPYILSALAAIDRSGRLSSLAFSSVYLAHVIAPLLGLYFVEGENYTPMIRIAITMLIVIGLISMAVLRRRDEPTTNSPSTTTLT